MHSNKTMTEIFFGRTKRYFTILVGLYRGTLNGLEDIATMYIRLTGLVSRTNLSRSNECESESTSSDDNNEDDSEQVNIPGNSSKRAPRSKK